MLLMTSSAISSIGDRIIGAVAGLLGKFKRKKKRNEEEDLYE